MTLTALSRRLGYSEFHTTRKFREIAGMPFRDYLRRRRLAFALIEVRDSSKSILEIALDHGFSSHAAFTRAFKETYGVTPSEYRRNPKPVVLRTKINPFDRHFLGLGEIGMMESSGEIKIYFVTIPAHKFLHIRNYEIDGYWGFWAKQEQILGQDCDTICGLLDSIKGKLDDSGVADPNSGSGQCMENEAVYKKLEQAMAEFDFADTGYCFDYTTGRAAYFYHNPERFWKYIRPVRKA